MRIFTTPGWITAPVMAIALGLAAAPAVAQTYSVNVHAETNGLAVKVEPVPTTGLLAINLTNETDQKVRCDLRYDASPQPLYRTTTYLKPHEKTQSAFRAKRKWMSVDVNVECKVDAK